jgi:hypothetical protein
MELLRKPKSDKANSGKAKPKAATLGAVEEPGATAPETDKARLQNLAADELFAILRDAWEIDQLKDLSDRLLSHIAARQPKTLRRPSLSDATAVP